MFKWAIYFVSTLLLLGCAAKESFQTIEPRKVEQYQSNYQGVRATVSVGNFDNRSNYLQGVFSSGEDRLGNQAKTILKSHLLDTNRFKVVDRENLSILSQEAGFEGKKQKIAGARYVVGGAVSEFGRRETGDKQLFGILGSGKKQTAYAKVTLTLVDVVSSQIIHTVQGAGEYALDNREVLGFGSRAGYDATLNGKVLDLAITEAVNHLVEDFDRGVFRVEGSK